MYQHLRSMGYFVEVLGSPITCFDASQYGESAEAPPLGPPCAGAGGTTLTEVSLAAVSPQALC